MYNYRPDKPLTSLWYEVKANWNIIVGSVAMLAFTITTLCLVNIVIQLSIMNDNIYNQGEQVGQLKARTEAYNILKQIDKSGIMATQYYNALIEKVFNDSGMPKAKIRQNLVKFRKRIR